jgi:hypothetical protein
MKLHVLGNEASVKELTESCPQVEWLHTSDLSSALSDSDTVMVVNLLDDAIANVYDTTKKIVLVNSVTDKLSKHGHGDHVVRINGWKGFLSRKTWELSGKSNETLDDFATACGISLKWLPDEPGFVAPRVISMIINEAYFALEQSVSDEKDVDIALKLGTNYPLGPFEWADKIGLQNVKKLLDTLATESPIYQPSALLSKKANEL